MGLTLGGNRPAPAAKQPEAKQEFTFGRQRGKTKRAQNIVIYGTGGVGKSTLAAMAPSPVFIDLENGTSELDVQRITQPDWTFDALCACLADVSQFAQDETVVIDSATRTQDLIIQQVVDNHDTFKSIEDWDYNKGYQMLCDGFDKYLALIQRLIANGKNVVQIAHDTTQKFQNPEGDNYVRFEPRLYHNHNKPTQTILMKVKESCDHLLFVKYDVIANKGKAQGSGTRAVYSAEMPYYMAKSRSLTESEHVYKLGVDPIFHKIFATTGDK